MSTARLLSSLLTAERSKPRVLFSLGTSAFQQTSSIKEASAASPELAAHAYLQESLPQSTGPMLNTSLARQSKHTRTSCASLQPVYKLSHGRHHCNWSPSLGEEMSRSLLQLQDPCSSAPAASKDSCARQVALLRVVTQDKHRPPTSASATATVLFPLQGWPQRTTSGISDDTLI